MTIPTRSCSYPFLSIARHFGIPYRDVLWLADAVERSPRHEWWPLFPPSISLEVVKEVEWQRRIRAGEIPFDARRD